MRSPGRPCPCRSSSARRASGWRRPRTTSPARRRRCGTRPTPADPSSRQRRAPTPPTQAAHPAAARSSTHESCAPSAGQAQDRCPTRAAQQAPPDEPSLEPPTTSRGSLRRTTAPTTRTNEPLSPSSGPTSLALQATRGWAQHLPPRRSAVGSAPASAARDASRGPGRRTPFAPECPRQCRRRGPAPISHRPPGLADPLLVVRRGTRRAIVPGPASRGKRASRGRSL